MRQLTVLASLLALPLLTTSACVTDEGEDGADDVAVPGGKADDSEFSACELEKIVGYLNEGVAAEALKEAGLSSRAAKNLVAHRDGADGAFGTADDDLFDDIAEVDAVPYIGLYSMRKLATVVGPRCEQQTDLYADARDVTLAIIKFPAGTTAPTSYQYPADTEFNLGGTEFWQKWTGGHNPTYSFEEGTDAGRLCMQASAIRFEAIMADPPAELVELNANSNWGGSFFNWNDDYSKADFGDASGARLWAWRTGLMKWISQTGKDGACHLPTKELVQRAAVACLSTARSSAGEIQGCSAR
ncbi:MAG: hypothetical protein KBG28_18270 [Kofleriaceae bacterium]|jgi:hypothetical protein|nr:hypothetical protein [Kofleriaceae bacterium]MBP6839677.1 hypothetical protein [Kofleriaceae bacterium]MBP9205927.1 hypothetical protein [Kofleriaceae bacterium]